MTNAYLVVKELDKYQHYKDRNIVWIKWYISNADKEFDSLPAASKWLFVGLIGLGCKCNNQVPYDLEWLHKELAYKEPIKLFEKYIDTLIDSKLIDKCYQLAMPIDKIDKIDIYSGADQPTPQLNSNSKLSSKDITLSEFNDFCTQSIEFLNQETGRKYNPKERYITALLKARSDEGRTLRDVKLVIASKCQDWLKDEKMQRYLRPTTLFNQTKFAEYLVEGEQKLQKEKEKNNEF